MLKYIIYLAVAILSIWSVLYVLRQVRYQAKGKCSNCGSGCSGHCSSCQKSR